MKIRSGFVSNSSSSSFVLDKRGMSKEQIRAIKKWVHEVANKDVQGETYVSESKKHFFGKMSYHLNPCLAEAMKENGINISALDEGD